MKNYLNKMLSIKKLLGAAVLLLMSFAEVKGQVTYATVKGNQDKITLRIGDPAPAIKYSKWLKGEPITSFKGDHVYVLEFWATWCSACIREMPHLTELQKEYEGKATFISVNAMEYLKEGQLYESALPRVEKFMKGNSANMGFSVFADNNDQHMRNNWHYASGHSNGLPATYIIKDERLIWMGSPMELDAVLPKIVDGSYDMAAFKAKYDKRADSFKKWQAEHAKTNIFKPVEDAEAAKEYKKALQLLEKLEAENHTNYDRRKFRILLKLSEKDAIAFGNKWNNSPRNKEAVELIYYDVADEDKLSKSTYLYAAKLYEEHSSNSSPLFFNSLASTYAKGGDYQKAIALQQKAIELAKAALAKGELAHRITKDIINQYEEGLAGYKKAAPKATKSSRALSEW